MACLIINKLLQFLRRCLGGILFLPYLGRYYFANSDTRKLHIGCGQVRLANWVNADITPNAELIVDIRWPLPFPTNFLNRVYCEHVIEHVSYETGVHFLKEVHRALAPGGVLRVATPDLDDIVASYQGNWKQLDWTQWREYAFIKTRAQMLNIAFRWWGHQHLYNREELARALLEAGFSAIQFFDRGESNHLDLRNLETRFDSKLIAEATK